MAFTKSFSELSKTDVALAGGKGASLGEMTQAKLAVPEGFVLLTNAFDRFIDETGLADDIVAELDKVKPDDVITVENASKEIQALILSKDVPDDLKEEVTSNFLELGSEFVAVRSSASAEDSASAAWAGQLDSYLNTTKDTLLENVQKCWASLFTPRAIAYRFEKKMHQDYISVAVVIQKMVNSYVSGIAFSVHPVTEDYNQLIIEAGFGLGEAIVSGSITPDSYVVDKRDLSLIEDYVSDQEKMMVRSATGGNEWVDCDNGDEQALSDAEVIELAQLVIRIEDHYGFPCDIEWAKEKESGFRIVQSRPITTLKKR